MPVSAGVRTVTEGGHRHIQGEECWPQSQHCDLAWGDRDHPKPNLQRAQLGTVIVAGREAEEFPWSAGPFYPSEKQPIGKTAHWLRVLRNSRASRGFPAKMLP